MIIQKELTPEEKWEQAGISNNFLFYYVMHNNPDICKELIELLLQIEIDHIEMAQEDQINVAVDSKSIRMDVFAKNAENSFNLEMQAADTKDLAKRARYYQGIIDVDTLKSGQKYSKLKESYIIFICLKDIFEEGMPVYHFENLCAENPKISLNDKAYKYFFISTNYAKIQNKRQRNFLELVINNKTSDEFSKRILESVAKAKQNVLVRKGFMEYERQRTYDIEAGMQKAKMETAIIAVKEFKVNPELVAEKYGVPLEDLIKALAE